MKKEENPVRKGLWDNPIPSFTAGKTDWKQTVPFKSGEQQKNQTVAYNSGSTQLK